MRLALASWLLLAASQPPSFDVPGSLSAFLEKGKWDATPASFRIIALSNLADGCAGQGRLQPGTEAKAHACVASVLSRAKALPASPDGLFLSHLNLIYGAADQVGPCLDEKKHAELSHELARRSLADPLFHAASYEKLSLRWPADQAATLASLARYDVAHGAHLHDEPFARWTKVLTAHEDPATKLPKSELTGKGPGAKHPRGCAQSYLVRYVSELDPALAATWWASYREHFLVQLGPVVGFREWPRGVERKADVDSGPIIMGIGAAASAFGVSAAKATGDFPLATQLEANKAAVLSTGAGGSAAQTILAQAISFQAAWQPVLKAP